MSGPVEYTNRKGKKYYLHGTTTKTGKIRYVMKRDSQGAVRQIPEGYAISESVNGQVSLGRIVPRQITEEEEAVVRGGLEESGLDIYRCSVKGKQITIYEPTRNVSAMEETIKSTMGFSGGFFSALLSELPASSQKRLREGIPSARETAKNLAERSPLEPVLRFTLVDEEKRLFGVERMTYLGTGGWRSLHKYGRLGKLLSHYLPHLGKESFFELL
jgi:hypothetical protein